MCLKAFIIDEILDQNGGNKFKEVQNKFLNSLFSKMIMDNNIDPIEKKYIGDIQRIGVAELKGLLKTHLEQSFCTPEIKHDPKSSKLVVRLSYIKPSLLLKFENWYMQTFTQVTKVSSDSLLHRNTLDIIHMFLNDGEVDTFTTTHEFTGSSLDEVKLEIARQSNITDDAKNTYSAAIDSICNKVNKADSKTIPTLKLAPEEELVFRKLLELYYLHQHDHSKPPLFTVTDSIRHAFEAFDKGSYNNYRGATQGLEAELTAAYNALKLARITHDAERSTEVTQKITAILEKAGALVDSDRARNKGAIELDKILTN